MTCLRDSYALPRVHTMNLKWQCEKLCETSVKNTHVGIAGVPPWA